MVGLMAGSWRERVTSLLNSAKMSPEIPAKMEPLRQLKEVLLHRDPSLLPEFSPRLADLQSGQPGPVRRFLAEMISEIGIKHMESLPIMIPILINSLKDETPAVARQAIISGTSLFHIVLKKVVIQGLYSNELNESLDSSWKWMLKFKDAVLPLAFQPGGDGIRLLAIKFVEATILLYTPDPNISSEPPHEVGDDFNISWLRGGHPVLKVGDLAIEASQSLGLLLDQLRLPQVKSLSNSIIIVLINCLSVIARKRPSFYGRILPVLLSLDPASSVIKGVQVSGAHHALRSAFVACLKCTHPGAAPWRARLLEALKAMNFGKWAEEAVHANDSCGSIVVSAMEPYSVKEEKLPPRTCDEEQGNLGQKRLMTEEVGDLVHDDGISGKRARSSPIVSQETDKGSHAVTSDHIHNNLSSTGSMISSGNGDSGPVQQLVGMFGALVAQGDKAAESLEILISSISADLLAEVVMANMRHLPSTCPKTEDEEEQALTVGFSSSLIAENQSFLQPSLVLDILSLSSALSMIDSRPLATHDIPKLQPKVEVKTEIVVEAPLLPSDIHGGITQIATSASIPTMVQTAKQTEASSFVPLYINNLENLESKIPGLEESLDISHSSTAELQGTSQEQGTSSDSALPLETTSSSGTLPCTGLSSYTISTSVVSSTQYLLPKMAAPVVSLTDDQKDNLQKVAYVSIIDAYKQMVVSGGSQIRFSLLACLGVEFPLELDAWGLLQKHILSDYLNHEGHELTLRVLYRLYQESEQDHDFFSSTAATSVYETFLLTVAETLRDSFPASDKSLSRLLSEVPYLPKALVKLLECMCCPESSEKNGKEFQSGDRVTQGLSIVWNLILLRPSNQDMCLNIALQSAVHNLEEVRMKAIRLVANKLFPKSCIAKKIEDFASEMLQSVVDGLSATEGVDAEVSSAASQKGNDRESPSYGSQTSGAFSISELSSDSRQLCKTENMSTSSISETQRRMSLYFALCTKKHSLLRQIFVIYRSIPKPAKQAVHFQIPILVRTIGSSSELLRIISDPPAGCESLLMQVLHTLTDGTIPSQELIFSVKKLYDSKLKDVEILIPILSSLSKDEVLPIFPQLVNLPMDKFQAALARILQGSLHSGPSITPAEVLIAIHEIDPEKDGIPLKKVMDASSACFEQRQVFTQQVLAKALNQLVEQIPLPLLFMRTVIQAVGAFPALVDFVMEILSRLVNKQIWKYPKLWVGFLKCAVQTQPQSFNVLLQLPAAQLENAVNRNRALKPPLIEHASQPNIRSTLPRSSLVVLGLAPDSQTSGPAQATESQATGTGNSVPDGGTETTQESTQVS